MLNDIRRWLLGAALTFVTTPGVLGGGNLTPIGAADAPVEIIDHHVDVVINNGFARTEVTQTFFNPNGVDLEATRGTHTCRSCSSRRDPCRFPGPAPPRTPRGP